MNGKIGLEEHFAIADTLSDSKGFLADRVWPELESRLSWSADVLGNGLCLAAVGTASVAALVYPIFLFLAAAAMTTVLQTSPARQRSDEVADTVAGGTPARALSLQRVVLVRPGGWALHPR